MFTKGLWEEAIAHALDVDSFCLLHRLLLTNGSLGSIEVDSGRILKIEDFSAARAKDGCKCNKNKFHLFAI